MKIHDKAVIKIMRLREALASMRSATPVETTKVALSALIDEVDKLPSIAADLFANEPARFAVQGPRSFPFAELAPGDHFDVEPERVNSLRACASGFARRHGMVLTVREKRNGGARCVRMDGVKGVPECIAELQALDPPAAPGLKQYTVPADNPAYRKPAAKPAVDPLNTPAEISPRTAFHAPAQDTGIEDPETADEVRSAMDIAEDKRTNWQQFIVDEYQHLIEFEHAAPSVEVVHQALLVDGVNRTPRQAWLVANHLHLLD